MLFRYIGPPHHGQSGPLVTAGGLVFISASSPHLYAFDKATGELVWQTELGGGGFGGAGFGMSMGTALGGAGIGTDAWSEDGVVTRPPARGATTELPRRRLSP